MSHTGFHNVIELINHRSSQQENDAMLNRIKAAAATIMFDAPRVSRTQRAARVLGAGLLGLLLSAPLSWAQLGGGNPPQPPTPTPTPSSELVFAASIITPED